MLDRIISYSFYLLFFLTPLFWTSLNFELFEYNKMILTYGFTVIIVGCWLVKAINDKRLTFKRTPLDIPLLLFLGANILSTIFSIDPHTSIWGYYSRSNGGLLSAVSYALLFWAYVSNMNPSQVKTTLKFGLLSGFIISVWGIFEHFGVSPSCVILRGEFNASCWVQDVQSRVFASLGQPNWLASYLAMLIFPALYFLLTATTQKQRIKYYISIIAMYLSFTFTYSRGPTLGLIAGMTMFLGLLLFEHQRELSLKKILVFKEVSKLIGNLKPLLIVILSFIFINTLFGSALTSFRLVSKFAPPPRPGISLPTTSVTQLETGGTESGQIRFIVWQGALDIFKHYPILGSGVETFAYSYYQFRPKSHNLTSEWDFLYNKAHNEYLNYLATTGIVGFGTYMFLIGTFIIWSLKRIYNLQFTVYKNNSTLYILHSTLLASYTSYLVYNFFLFSVVIIAIFFYLFPALAFVATESTKPVSKLFTFRFSFLTSILNRRPVYTKITKAIVILATFYLLYSIFKLWYADTFFASGEKAEEAGNPGRAYNLLTVASDLNKEEPFYLSELGYNAAATSAALKETDATLSGQLKDEALAVTDKAFKISPKNVSFRRTAVRTYFELATVDKKYIDQTLRALDQIILLAPTDPKPFYNKALVLDSIGKKDEAIKNLEQAINLKPNYQEALAQLQEATTSSAK